MNFKFIWVTLLTLLFTGCWGGEPTEEHSESLGTGRGVITYSGYAPLSHKPVKVHYYIPKGDKSRMPILFVFPGVNRNADEYLDAWKVGADQKNVMVFSLEFPRSMYSTEEYIEGGMFSGTTLKPESAWTFSLIEPLFDYLKKELNGSQATFDLWGHSAGAQFVHRYFLFKPAASVGKAVSANAGWYTVPDLSVEYPYGLKNSPASSATLQQVFGKNLILQLGTADTDPNDSSLNHSPGAELQGPHRYARGLYFWDRSRISSQPHNIFKWMKYEVPGVAHSYSQMAANAWGFMY
ncbi:MAG: hypothetical protein ACRC9Q_01010 [Bacteroidales bacterium]